MRDYNEKGYKSHKIQGEGSFGFLGLGFLRGSVLSIFWGEVLLIKVCTLS